MAIQSGAGWKSPMGTRYSEPVLFPSVCALDVKPCLTAVLYAITRTLEQEREDRDSLLIFLIH